MRNKRGQELYIPGPHSCELGPVARWGNHSIDRARELVLQFPTSRASSGVETPFLTSRREWCPPPPALARPRQPVQPRGRHASAARPLRWYVAGASVLLAACQRAEVLEQVRREAAFAHLGGGNGGAQLPLLWPTASWQRADDGKACLFASPAYVDPTSGGDSVANGHGSTPHLPPVRRPRILHSFDSTRPGYTGCILCEGAPGWSHMSPPATEDAQKWAKKSLS
eukprot:scaffold2045_cov404-Prasinococcus_capsulatus_cf.AAC.62